MSELLQLKLEDASLDEIAELALRAIGPNASAKKDIEVIDLQLLRLKTSIVVDHGCQDFSKAMNKYHRLTQPETSIIFKVG